MHRHIHIDKRETQRNTDIRENDRQTDTHQSMQTEIDIQTDTKVIENHIHICLGPAHLQAETLARDDTTKTC